MKSVKLFVSIQIILSLLLFAACGATDSNEGAGQSEASKVQTTGDPAAAPDPFGKYSPPIEVSTITTTITSDIKFPEGDTPENNIWTRTYFDELGIKLNILWSCGDDKAEEKRNLMIASGDLPDLFTVSRNQFEQLYNAGKLEDLTQAFEQYASPFVKDFIYRDGGIAMKSAEKDGKLFAVPFFLDYTDSTSILWIRTDWLQKLNLPEPKTMEDVFKIAEAFKNRDPDGNSLEDTYGIPMTKNLISGSYFNAFHAYPSIWIKNSSGSLVFGGIQPEMKAALLKLQEFYKNGIIPKEFGVMDDNKYIEDALSSKFGVIFGSLWEPWWPLQQMKDKDPNYEMKPFPIPSIDDKPASIEVPGLNVLNYIVVKKGAKNPEALLKLVNVNAEKNFGKTSDVNKYNINSETGNSIYRMSPVYVEPPRKNYYVYKNIDEALKSKDTSQLNSEEKQYYDNIQKYMNGDNSHWFEERCYGPEGSCSVIDHYLGNKLYMLNEFTGIPTTSMLEKGAVLDKLYKETVTRIIMGADISEYDAYVEKWKSLGGDEMTKEVNDWYASQSK